MRHRTYRGEIYGENGDTSMTVEIKVGPPVITIDQGNLFMVTDQRGEIDPDSEHGLFAEDTASLASTRYTSIQRPGNCSAPVD